MERAQEQTRVRAYSRSGLLSLGQSSFCLLAQGAAP